jgi:DNA invertase Pin-like site-specific DNA recombinase
MIVAQLQRMKKKQQLHDLIDIEALALAAAGRFETAYLIYCRKSTDDPNNQQNSIGYQEIENTKFARTRELPVANLTWPGFCADGIIRERHSGHKQDAHLEITADGKVTHQIVRPKFAILVQLLARRVVKGVVVLSWDRLSRNDGDSALIKKLKARGVAIHFQNTTYSEGSAGGLHMSIDATFAGYYSAVISDKVRDALRKMRNEGKCTYRSPIGYLDQGAANKVIDPERGPIVREIFAKYETGEWSQTSLAQWAKSQGLTTKPFRRPRTREELLDDIEPSSIPRTCMAVSHKTIENILTNPFYIGKIRVFAGQRSTEQWLDGIHPPLISAATFQNVQAVLRQRHVSVHYPHLVFHLFRGALRCGCGRSYSPYVKKGITYYRTRCKAGCANRVLNINEKKLDQLVVKLLRGIALTADELRELEIEGNAALTKVSTQREAAVAGLSRERQKLRADLDYLTRERWTLLRTGAVQPDAIRSEEDRLERAIAEVEKRLVPHELTAKDMIEGVVSFTELIRDLASYYERALDVEKHALLSVAFTELILDDGILKYRAKEGFDVLLNRYHTQNGPSVPQRSVLPNSSKERGRYILAHLEEFHTALKKVSGAITQVKNGGVQMAA